MPLKVVYWFEDTSDSAKCEGNACQPMEGWYDDYPDRPHGGLCDCEIWSYAGWADHVYKNYAEEDGGDLTHTSEETTTYPNPNPTESVEATVEVSFEVKRTVEVEVSDIMTHFGFSGSAEETRTITRTLPVRIPPMQEAKVTVTISGTVTHYSAEKWAVWSNTDSLDMTPAPEGGEVFIELVKGGTVYEENSDVEFEVELNPL